MECKKVHKVFKVIGIKRSGKYADFGTEVPKMAQQLLSRRDEIDHVTDTEVALYEPKRGEEHVEGTFIVGLLVEQTPEAIPLSMEYMEESREYVTAKGNINDIGNIHHRVFTWSEENGYSRDPHSLIVETYHPLPTGGEEVAVYMPVK